VIAPFYRQAVLFIGDSGWDPQTCKIVIREDQLLGLDLSTWEVWWLDRMWPCSTHEDVEHMERFKIMAKVRGASLRRWWT